MYCLFVMLLWMLGLDHVDLAPMLVCVRMLLWGGLLILECVTTCGDRIDQTTLKDTNKQFQKLTTSVQKLTTSGFHLPDPPINHPRKHLPNKIHRPPKPPLQLKQKPQQQFRVCKIITLTNCLKIRLL